MDQIAMLEETTRKYLLGVMAADLSGELAKLSLSDLLIQWGTWKRRQISSRPRRAHRSTELRASAKAVEHAAALAAIVAKIEAGEDLSVHLSKAVEENRGLDRMLADDVVHLRHSARGRGRHRPASTGRKGPA